MLYTVVQIIGKSVLTISDDNYPLTTGLIEKEKKEGCR
jgi:hypothetical protein